MPTKIKRVLNGVNWVVILVTLMSPLSHAVTPIVLSTTSDAYREFTRNKKLSSKMVQVKLLSFARQGELSAVHTLALAEPNLDAMIEFLRSLDPEKNMAAASRLASALFTQQTDECLSWFERVEESKFKTDFMFSDDYAMALLLFGGEYPESRAKSLQILLRQTSRIESLVDVTRFRRGFRHLFAALQEFGDYDLTATYIDWVDDQQDGNVHFYAHKSNSLALFIETNSEGYLAKSIQEMKLSDMQTGHFRDFYHFNEVIKANLDQVLQEEENKNFPIFAFGPASPVIPTDQQISFWAKAIVREYRSSLTHYTGKNPYLNTFFREIKNSTIEPTVFRELKKLLVDINPQPTILRLLNLTPATSG